MPTLPEESINKRYELVGLFHIPKFPFVTPKVYLPVFVPVLLKVKEGILPSA
jgi:hypothetical protein